MAIRSWEERDVGPLPEPRYQLTEPKVKKAKDVPTPAQAIPPHAEAVSLIEEAAVLLEKAWRLLDAADRKEDAFYIQPTISDIRYRHLLRVRQTACTRCSGYRGDVQLGVPCRCQL